MCVRVGTNKKNYFLFLLLKTFCEVALKSSDNISYMLKQTHTHTNTLTSQTSPCIIQCTFVVVDYEEERMKIKPKYIEKKLELWVREKIEALKWSLPACAAAGVGGAKGNRATHPTSSTIFAFFVGVYILPN